jgi:ubiquinone/menaquinone biosynthesis C-methylase UbiE
MRGATLMVAAGTGNDFKFFPPNLHVVAIDISPKMLERAARKASAYSGSIELRQMDVCALEFADSTFDVREERPAAHRVPQLRFDGRWSFVHSH